MPGVRAALRVPDARWAVACLPVVRWRRSAEAAVGLRRRCHRRPAFHARPGRVVRHVRRSARPRLLLDELILTLLSGGAGGPGGAGGAGRAGRAGKTGAFPFRAYPASPALPAPSTHLPAPPDPPAPPALPALPAPTAYGR